MFPKDKHIINLIKDAGFEKVHFYDEYDNEYFYDALINDNRVEVRISNNQIYWRFLGVKDVESIEWFSVGDLHKTESTPKEEEIFIVPSLGKLVDITEGLIKEENDNMEEDKIEDEIEQLVLF